MVFKDLNISKQILMALEEAGYEKPTPIQVEVFPVTRSGRDVIGIAQTGTGKTLAYLMPILMKLGYAQGYNPRAAVIVPTRELVVQICETLEILCEFMDIRYQGIYGGTNIRTQQEKIIEGVDLIIATPGRFMDIYMNGVLRTQQVKTIVIDEADKLMDMGFIPQLRAIIDVIPAKHQTLLFSATFSESVSNLSDEFLINPARVEVAPQATTVENIDQLAFEVPNIMTKINLLRLILANEEVFKKVMVFTESKKNADRIVSKLEMIWKDDLSIIHSNKAQNSRLNALRSFKEGRSRILVASDVAARGIDIQDVTHVVNFDIPSLPEEYVHRIGRTGRAGKEGTAISFISEKELDRFKAIEELIGLQVDRVDLPEELEISDILLDEEKVQTSNIVYQRGKPQGGGAYHSKAAKNSKQNKKVRLDRSKNGKRVKKKK